MVDVSMFDVRQPCRSTQAEATSFVSFEKIHFSRGGRINRGDRGRVRLSVQGWRRQGDLLGDGGRSWLNPGMSPPDRAVRQVACDSGGGFRGARRAGEAGMHAHRCSRMRERRSRWHKNGPDARGPWTMDGDGVDEDHNTYCNSTIVRFGRRIEGKEEKGKGNGRFRRARGARPDRVEGTLDSRVLKPQS
jgi:hypothetical protein